MAHQRYSGFWEKGGVKGGRYLASHKETERAYRDREKKSPNKKERRGQDIKTDKDTAQLMLMLT